MTDAGRKPMGDKIKETITPNSTKSTQQKMKEGITDSADTVAREAQPDDSKSTGQSLADKAGRSKDTHEHGGSGGGIVDSMKHAVGADKK